MKNILTFVVLVLVISVTTAIAVDYKVDPSFQPPVFTGPFSEKINTTLVLPDGKIMVGGSFTGVDSQPIKYLVRLNSDGTRDTNFNSALADSPEFGIDEVRGLRVLPDGKLLVMGSFEVNGNWAYYARLNADGSLDTSMATGTNLTFDMLPLPDGDFIVCGPGAGSAVAHRVNSDGSPDPSFQISVFPQSQCNNAALVDDGKILIAGSFREANGNYHQPIYRFNSDGSLDGTFQTQLPGNQLSNGHLTLMPDGRIMLGYIPNISGGRVITRLQSNGQVEMTVPECGEANGSYRLTTAGTLLVRSCRKFSGAPFYEFAIVRPDGRLMPDLDILSFQGTIYGFEEGSGGKYYVFGSFTGIEGVARPGLARLMQRAPNLKAKFDFDGDGKSDYAVFRPSDRYWYIYRSTDGPFYQQWGLSTDIPVAGDYDFDGKWDISVFRDGAWYLSRSSAGVTWFVLGAAGDTPMVGDFQGFPYEARWNYDFAVRRVQGGSVTWHTATDVGWTPSSGIITGELPADTPVVGDFDGDSRDEIGYFRDGVWTTRDSIPGAPTAAFSWGVAGDIPVPEDYDGDGQTDYAVFRPSTGVWWINRSTAGTLIAAWGTNGDIPVPADYDGDGKADIAIYRNGEWWQHLSGSGSARVALWGVTGDTPIEAQAQ
jgi:uncharacterized delta-60 repeat protein